MGGLIGVLFFISAINAGVIVFTFITMFFHSIRWQLRLFVGLLSVLLAFVAQWIGLYFLAGAGSGETVPITLLVLYILFHTVSLAAVLCTIVWLVKRKVKGSLGFIKWTALPLASMGACITLATLIFASSLVWSLATEEAGSRRIVVPDSSDYHGNE